MDQVGHFFGQSFVGGAGFRLFEMLLFQRRNFFARKKCKVFQVSNHVSIIEADPKLVKAVGTGSPGIQPYSASHSFPEFAAIRVGDERKRQAVNLHPELSSTEIAARGDVAPLIAATHLEFAVKLLA